MRNRLTLEEIDQIKNNEWVIFSTSKNNIFLCFLSNLIISNFFLDILSTYSFTKLVFCPIFLRIFIIS